MKELHLLEDDNFGFMEVTNKVGVSLSSLNRAFKNEKKLIKAICVILHHEWLHYAIEDTIWNLYSEREEEIVEELSNSDSVQRTKCKELFWLVEVDDDLEG